MPLRPVTKLLFEPEMFRKWDKMPNKVAEWIWSSLDAPPKEYQRFKRLNAKHHAGKIKPQEEKELDDILDRFLLIDILRAHALVSLTKAGKAANLLKHLKSSLS